MPDTLNAAQYEIDRRFAIKEEAEVNRAQFEGGYSQRSTGPNATVMTVSVSWIVDDAQRDTIVTFLRERRGAVSFYYTPFGESERLWSCDKWESRVFVPYPDGSALWEIRATLTQEFDLV